MIRSLLLFLFFALFGLFLQSGVIHGTFPSAAAPDFILILVVNLGLRFRTPTGALGAFCLGLLSDFASGQYLGPNAGGAVAAFCLAGVIANRVYAEKGGALMVIAFLCSLGKTAIVLLLMYMHVGIEPLGGGFLTAMFIEAAGTGICAPIVMAVLRWSQQTTRAHRRKTTGSSRYGWSAQA